MNTHKAHNWLIALAMSVVLVSAANAQTQGQTVTQNGVKVELKLSGGPQGNTGTDSTSVTYSANKPLKLTVPSRTPLDSWQLGNLARAYPERAGKYAPGLKAGSLTQDELIALLVCNPESGQVPAKSNGPKPCSKPAIVVTVRELRTKTAAFQNAVNVLVNVSPEFKQEAKVECLKLAELNAALAPLMDDEQVLLTAIDKLNGRFDLCIGKFDALAGQIADLRQLIVDNHAEEMDILNRIDRRTARIERMQTVWGFVGIIGDVANLLKRYTTTIKTISDCGGGCGGGCDDGCGGYGGH